MRTFSKINLFFVLLCFVITGGLMNNSVCMIGHRGYSSRHTDNTAESFIAAAKHGSGGVETDVRVTKDGVLVLSHDAEAEFNDGTELAIADSNYDELTAKPLKGRAFEKDVYICTFERYLEICKEYDMICFIEFKGAFTDDNITKAFEMAKEIYTLDKCSLQSDVLENLIKAHELYPELDIMFTCAQSDLDAGITFEQLIDLGFSIDISYQIATKESVKMFHDAGLEYGVWTCNDPMSLIYGYYIGADYIESDVF